MHNKTLENRRENAGAFPASQLRVRPLNMKKMINFFWNPDKKTVQGFKYGAYISLAPVLLLCFILPGAMILGILFVFFILRSIVSIRAAATHDIDKEKWEKYSGKDSEAKRAYVIFYVMIVGFSAAIILFFIKTGGFLGLILTILVATITLPTFFGEIVIIKRCQMKVEA